MFEYDERCSKRRRRWGEGGREQGVDVFVFEVENFEISAVNFALAVAMTPDAPICNFHRAQNFSFTRPLIHSRWRAGTILPPNYRNESFIPSAIKSKKTSKIIGPKDPKRNTSDSLPLSNHTTASFYHANPSLISCPTAGTAIEGFHYLNPSKKHNFRNWSDTGQSGY